MDKRPHQLVLSGNFNTFAKLRKEGVLLDVTFIVSNSEKITAHKIVLAAASPYFKSMFTRWSQNEYSINGVDPDFFKLLIDSIYGKDILTNDWYVLLNLIILIRYFLIDIDIDPYVKLIDVPSKDIITYIAGLNVIFPEGFSVEYIDHIADKLKSDIDLSFLTDEMIHLIFSSVKYQPLDELITFKIIDRLVQQHKRDINLYKLVRFESIPKHIRKELPHDILDKFMNKERRDSSDSNHLIPSFNDFVKLQSLKYNNDFDLANKSGYESMIVRVCLPVGEREYQTPHGIKTFGPETLIKGGHPTQSRRAVFNSEYESIKYNDIIEIIKYELERDFDVGKGRIYFKINEWRHFL